MAKHKNNINIILFLSLIGLLLICIYKIETQKENYQDIEDTVDIFIKTYKGDFVWLEYLIRSIKKFAKGFRDVVIVSDDDGNLIPDNIKSIMPLKIFYEKVPTNINFMDKIGYNWQQYIKLNWMKYSDADAIFILDSDNMLTKPIYVNDIKTNGKYNWIYRNWHEAGEAQTWKDSTDYILGIDTKYEAMAVSGFLFTKNTTIQFKKYLKEKYNKDDFWDIIIDKKIPKFSEFNIYGNFIYSFYKNDYNIIMHSESNNLINKTLLQSWSWGGLNDEEKMKREKILSIYL